MGLAPQARSLPAIHALLHNAGQGRIHENSLADSAVATSSPPEVCFHSMLMFVLSRLATPAEVQRLDNWPTVREYR
jgi:hypothetical protein